MDTEIRNLHAIEQLNQRGGRTLSIVDLILAGTLGVEMAAVAMRAIRLGASIVTAAGPGGAGKPTLLGALLDLLPPGEPIRPVDRRSVLAEPRTRPDTEPACYLVHEIGQGAYYGYLWGPAVGEYFALARGRRRIATTLHADSIEEIEQILCSPPLDVARDDFGRVGLVLVMHVEWLERGLPRRRVLEMHESDGQGGHRLLYRLDSAGEGFDRIAPPRDPGGLALYVEWLERLLADEVVELTDVRRRLLEFYAD